MKLRANILAIAVVGASLVPFPAHGQVTFAQRAESRTCHCYAETSGISRPLPQDVLRTGIRTNPAQLSFRQSDDTSQSSRTHTVIVGALVGGAIGLGTGLILDHTGKSGGTGSGEHITYTFEVYTIPIGVVIGALSGLLIPTHSH